MKYIWPDLTFPPLNLWNYPNPMHYYNWVLGIPTKEPEVRNNTTDLVVNDLRQREVMGYNKYGKYLNEDTDEDMLNHLYEEILDAAMYIRTLLEQRKKKYE